MMKKMLFMLALFAVLSITHVWAAEADVSYTDSQNQPVYYLKEGILQINASVEAFGDDTIMINAMYDEDRLIGLDMQDISGIHNESRMEVPRDACILKTMFWEQQSQKPVLPAKILTKNSYQLIKYHTTPGALKSEIYAVCVNGEDIFTEDYKDVSYARFASGGKIEVGVTYNEDITSYDISPHSRNIKAEVNGNRLTFQLQSEEKLIITVNHEKKLFLFNDKPEVDAPEKSDSGVYILTDFEGIDHTGETVITESFQRALDTVSQTGGILYIPDGKYLTGSLKVLSNTTVYLESGALIQGTSDKADYPSTTWTQDSNEVLVSSLICFNTAENSKLTGRGVIDGDGLNLRATGRDAWLISLIECNNVQVRDVVLRDPAAFNSHILYSDHVLFENVKIINDLTNPNTDGIDPDCSRDVTIRNNFMYCSDDNISVKTHRYSTLIRNSYDITVEDNVLWTIKSALKIGNETSSYQVHDITYRNNDVIHADRVMTIYVYDGSNVSNIYFLNNRAEQIGGDFFERPIDFEITTRTESCNTPGIIENILIKDFYAEEFGGTNSKLVGYDTQHKIKNVYIDNFVIAGKNRTTLSDAQITAGKYTENIVMGKAPEFTPINEELPAFDRRSIFMEENGYISIEAEHYSEKTEGTAQWKEISEDEKRGATGGTAMYASSGSYVNYGESIAGSPRLDYKVNFTEAGTYYVWARTYGYKRGANTLNLGYNGMMKGTAKLLVSKPAYGGWYWNNANKSGGYMVLNITAPGVYTINVWAGATEMYFDKLILMKAESGEVFPQYMSTGRKGVGFPESLVVLP